MVQINLKKIYPSVYKQDYFIEVSEELAEQFDIWRRAEAASRRQMYRYKAYYSLDREDGIETEIFLCIKSAEEEYMEKDEILQLLHALQVLPQKQSKRIYEKYMLKKLVAEIAREESVSKGAVGKSIYYGLKNLRKMLENLEE